MKPSRTAVMCFCLSIPFLLPYLFWMLTHEALLGSRLLVSLLATVSLILWAAAFFLYGRQVKKRNPPLGWVLQIWAGAVGLGNLAALWLFPRLLP